jgi:drug/metabolite transporter (DMT)-like permease
MSHGRAVGLMVLVTLMWSIAGVVTRQLEVARSFEITFWRSFFNALALALMLGVMRGPGPLVRSVREGGRSLWLSGLCWCVMYTAFMMALSLTTVANVLVTMALAPLFTALLARVALGHRVAARTWTAILVAGAGIAWMYGTEVDGAQPRHLAGMLVAVAVPAAAAVNWIVLQHMRHGAGAERQDMLPAVLIGAALSALLTLPLAWPLAAPLHDVALLALLGVVQLAIPCLLAVSLTRVLSAPEIALLSLLEVMFGVAWAWIGAGEQPSSAVLGGGTLVLGALVANEAVGAYRSAKVNSARLN